MLGDALQAHDGVLDLGVEEGDAAREFAQGEADDACQAVVIGSDAERRARPEQLTAGQVPQSGAQLVGAVTCTARIWLIAWVRALFALRCNDFRARRASTGPSWVLGVPVASPDSTARAAAIASTTSLLP